MAKKKSKVPTETVGTVGGFPVVEGSHKELIENVTGKELSKEEWGSIRQCIRCMTQGQELVKAGDEPRKVTPKRDATPMSALDAVNAVLKESKKYKGKDAILKAARKLTFVDK